jgi:hypothetical protein
MTTLSTKITNQSLIMTSTSVKNNTKCLPFHSAVCTLLYLAYNTRADVLFAVCKLAKACICPGETDFCALTWLIGYLQRRPYYAIKFYPDTTSNPVYNVCRQLSIPHSYLTVIPMRAGKIAQTLAALPSDI